MDLHWQSNVSAFKNYIIEKTIWRHLKPLLLLLSHFSRVRLCATPWTADHQAPPSLGFSRQEHWSGLPVPSSMHESEKWKWNCSVVSDSSRPHGLQPTRILRPWDFPGESTRVGCHCFLLICIHHILFTHSSAGGYLGTTDTRTLNSSNLWIWDVCIYLGLFKFLPANNF